MKSQIDIDLVWQNELSAGHMMVTIYVSAWRTLSVSMK